MHKGQLDRFLSLLERAVVVAERWADVEYPKRDETGEAEIYHLGEEHKPQTPEEYEEFEGRFGQRYLQAHPEAKTAT